MLKKSNNIYWLLGGIPKKEINSLYPKFIIKILKVISLGKKKKFIIDLNKKLRFKNFQI